MESKKFLDFIDDKPEADDKILIASSSKGVRKTSLANLRFQYLSFEGTTDENGFVRTELSYYGNHPISVNIPLKLTIPYPDTNNGVFTVKVMNFDGSPLANTDISGTIYYVAD